MDDFTGQSDRILREAKALLQDNQNGGRQRRLKTLGRGAKQLKMQHYMRKFTRILMAVFAILVAAMGAGLVLNGIGFIGVMATVFTLICAVILLSVFPHMKTPQIEDINRGSVTDMVGRTQLWLAQKTSALPAPSAQLLEHMGVQLDGLGAQLASIDGDSQEAGKIRQLVGEVLPQTVDAYVKIPPHLRGQDYAGTSPNAQLQESLTNISQEIDALTRTLAEGSLDSLAIKNRYIAYKYGAGVDTPSK